MSVVVGEGRFQKVSLSQLVTDGRFNRPVRDAHVSKISSGFVPRAIGTIELWKREDGRFVILDGQHRVEAMRSLGVPDAAKCVPAMVHDDLTLDQAAELFVLLNATKLVSAYDKYRALLTAGHSETCDIERIVRVHGLRVGVSGDHDGQISAVAALRDVYKLGEPEGVVLGITLASLHQGWRDASEAYKSAMLKGVALYVHQHRDVVPAELGEALVRRAGAPINLIGWAKLLSGPQRMPLHEAIATTIEDRVMKRRTRLKKVAS